MGKFRSLFDPDEVRQLGIDSGLIAADAPAASAPLAAPEPLNLLAEAVQEEAAEVPLREDLAREAAITAPPVEHVPAAPTAPQPVASVRLTTEGTPVLPPPNSPVTMIPGSITRLPDPRVEARAIATPMSTQSVGEQVSAPTSRHITRELEPAVPRETGFARNLTGPQPTAAAAAPDTAVGRVAAHLGRGGLAPWRMMLRASLLSRVPSEVWFQSPEPEPHLVAALNGLGVSIPAGGLPWQG